MKINQQCLTAAKFQPGRLAVRQVFPTLVSKLSRDKAVAVFIPADNLAAGVRHKFKKNMENQTILDNIEKEVFKQLKPLGFKKKGRTFNRKTEEGIYQVINFQAGQYPIGDNYVVPGLRENLYGKFTINLGICVEEIFVINFPHKTKDYYLEYDCQFRNRLGTLMKGNDYWWPLIENSESVISEIIEGMNSLGLPWLNLFATREQIMANSKFLDKGRAKFDLGIIMLKIDKEKGTCLIQEYVNELKPSQNGHKEVVLEIAKELGLKINKTSA